MVGVKSEFESRFVLVYREGHINILAIESPKKRTIFIEIKKFNTV